MIVVRERNDPERTEVIAHTDSHVFVYPLGALIALCLFGVWRWAAVLLALTFVSLVVDLERTVCVTVSARGILVDQRALGITFSRRAFPLASDIEACAGEDFHGFYCWLGVAISSSRVRPAYYIGDSDNLSDLDRVLNIVRERYRSANPPHDDSPSTEPGTTISP